MQQGLGTQLALITEYLDGAVAESYQKVGLDYRPRYTPIMRALLELGTCTMAEIAECAGISQSATTQTLKLMAKAELVTITVNENDHRQRLIQISPKGQQILPKIQACWSATNQAAASLEQDLGFSLHDLLGKVIEVLREKSFLARIQDAEKQQR